MNNAQSFYKAFQLERAYTGFDWGSLVTEYRNKARAISIETMIAFDRLVLTGVLGTLVAIGV